MRFGEFLISRKLVSEEQLLAALDEQARSAPFAGTLAVQLGFITPQQVLEIAQGTQEANLEFLELARRRGLLSEKQIAMVIQSQSENTPKLGQIFVRQNVVGEAQLAPLLRAFFSVSGATPTGI